MEEHLGSKLIICENTHGSMCGEAGKISERNFSKLSIIVIIRKFSGCTNEWLQGILALAL